MKSEIIKIIKEYVENIQTISGVKGNVIWEEDFEKIEERILSIKTAKVYKLLWHEPLDGFEPSYYCSTILGSASISKGSNGDYKVKIGKETAVLESIEEAKKYAEFVHKVNLMQYIQNL